MVLEKKIIELVCDTLNACFIQHCLHKEIGLFCDVDEVDDDEDEHREKAFFDRNN